MKLAKATQAEIDTLMRWLQDKEAAKFEDAKNRPPAFMRVVFGYETLVNNCCDPSSDVLDWKPGYAPSDTDRYRAALTEILANAEAAYAHRVSAPAIIAIVREALACPRHYSCVQKQRKKVVCLSPERGLPGEGQSRMIVAEG